MPHSANDLLEALLSGLFDYAGMFPPASLSFDAALATAAAFPDDLKHPWLVGTDLVLSVEHAERMRPELLGRLNFSDQRPFKVCVLGSPITTAGEADARARQNELRLLERFNSAGKTSAVKQAAVSYEIKLSAAALTDHHSADDAFRIVRGGLAGQELKIFIEPDLSGPGWEHSLDTICAILSSLNELDSGPPLGLKFRLSGPTALTAAKLVKVVELVASNQLHAKATAGLHHPIVERSRYQNDFGFLNLHFALLLKRYLGSAFSESDVLACLCCDKAELYGFEEAIRWSRFELPFLEMQSLRREFHFSIGSCSLHEPDQDLLRLFL